MCCHVMLCIIIECFVMLYDVSYIICCYGVHFSTSWCSVFLCCSKLCYDMSNVMYCSVLYCVSETCYDVSSVNYAMTDFIICNEV